MDERLQVRIEADISNFKQGMSQVERNLQRAEGIFSSSSKSVFQLENAIAQLSEEYKSGALSSGNYAVKLDKLNAELSQQRGNVSASAKEIKRLNSLMDASRVQKVATANSRLGQSFRGLNGNIRGAQSTALEFNRIIQDAPFGIMGVGNNIQQLAGNFSSLSNKVGGTVPALKAAFSALITGPNLALLAISAVTAGITAYNMGAFDFLKSNKEVKKSFEDLKEESEEYIKNLDSISRSHVGGIQSAQAQITSLKLLYARTQDVATSEEERVKAVRELQKVYPQVFGNLNEEIILNGQAKKSYDELTTSILASAKARAAEETLVENEKQLIALNRERVQVLDEIAKKEEQAAKASERFTQAPGSLTPQFRTADQQEANSALSQANELYERYAELNKQVNGLEKDNLGLVKEIGKEQANVTVETGKAASVVDKVGKSLKDFKPIDSAKLFNINPTQLQKDIEASYKTISDELKNSGTFVDIPVKVDFTPESLTGDAKKENDDIVKQFHAQKEAIEVIFEDLGRSMQNSLSGAFDGAILNGENFFDAVVDGFKKMLAQLAAQLAAAAVIKVLAMIIGGPAGAALAGGSGMGGSILSGLFSGAGMRIGQTPAMGVPTGSASNAAMRVDVNVQGVLKGNDIHVAQQRNNRNFDRYF